MVGNIGSWTGTARAMLPDALPVGATMDVPAEAGERAGEDKATGEGNCGTPSAEPLAAELAAIAAFLGLPLGESSAAAALCSGKAGAALLNGNNKARKFGIMVAPTKGGGAIAGAGPP